MGAGSGMEHGIGCIAFEATKLIADGWFEHIKRTLVSDDFAGHCMVSSNTFKVVSLISNEACFTINSILF